MQHLHDKSHQLAEQKDPFNLEAKCHNLMTIVCKVLKDNVIYGTYKVPGSYLAISPYLCH